METVTKTFSDTTISKVDYIITRGIYTCSNFGQNISDDDMVTMVSQDGRH